MKKECCALLIGALLSPHGLVHAAEFFADQVVSYTAGLGVGGYTNPGVALGKPGGNIGSGTFNPFSANFSTAELARIGSGGELTLRLSDAVVIDRTPGVPEIGVWENVALIAASGGAGNPATAFGQDSATVSVSADGIAWFSLNDAQPILFTLPGNFYANASGSNAAPPANPVLADFGKPFSGALTDFDGKSFADILTILDGSAGGTWLDLDSTGLDEVRYLRFDGVASGQTLEINAVSINSARAASAIPEPGVAALLCLGTALGLRRRRP